MIIATEHVRPMRGGSRPHLLRANDGHRYVVKFANNPQGHRILANEWLAGRLAAMLGLPVPPCAQIEVPAELVEASPGLTLWSGGRHLPVASGTQFGSRLPCRDHRAPIYDYLPEASLEQIENLADFAGMLCFDKWTCNCDGRQVVYCRPAPSRPIRAYMIDHGFCFDGQEWMYPDSPLRGVCTRPNAYTWVTGWHSFEPWLSRIESLDPHAIRALADELPAAWVLPVERPQLAALLDRLVERRASVRGLIQDVRRSLRAPFPAWADGAAAAA